ncbi:hypothetical protein tb265_18810 [Gemmatimonadetes bacterium T265]|nr:hypothetical protein tb265_18810 [Gemmatimonadetes bacterium T265]
MLRRAAPRFDSTSTLHRSTAMRLRLPPMPLAALRAPHPRPTSPIPPRLWLASAACEAAVALGAAGALFATHTFLFR